MLCNLENKTIELAYVVLACELAAGVGNCYSNLEGWQVILSSDKTVKFSPVIIIWQEMCLWTYRSIKAIEEQNASSICWL